MASYRFLTICLLVVCSGFSPIWANPDDSSQTPGPVETFFQYATEFADTIKDVPGFSKTTYLEKINAIKAEVEQDKWPTENLGYTANYFQVVGQKVQAMNTQVQESSNPYKTDIQAEYIQAVSNYVQGDCRAFVNSWAVEKNEAGKMMYEDYYENLNKLYGDRLATVVTNTNNGQKVKTFEPSNFLDRGSPGVYQFKKIGVSVYSGGIYDKWVSQTIRKMVTDLKGKYSYDTQLQEDLNWFLTVWPQGSEVDVTTAQSTGKYVHTASDDTAHAGSGKELQLIDANYTLNDYGQPTDASEEQLPTTGLTNYPLVDQVYLDRSYGYNTTSKTGYAYTGWNGTTNTSTYHVFNTVSIQVGDRKYQLYDALAISPIVLDLDGDGNLEASKGEWLPHPYNGSRLVEFDINGDDFIELTEWVGEHDGVLLQYNNERDINANQFFGEAGGFSDGYEKLSLLDANNDKQLTGDELKTLSVWQDKNNNARIDTGEVSAVTTLGITSISLAQEDLISSFTQNGVTKKMWDWYPVTFRVKRTK